MGLFGNDSSKVQNSWADNRRVTNTTGSYNPSNTNNRTWNQSGGNVSIAFPGGSNKTTSSIDDSDATGTPMDKNQLIKLAIYSGVAVLLFLIWRKA